MVLPRHHCAQVGNQACDLHSQATLPQHLGAHVYGCLAPLLALATPAMIDHMLGHPDRRWGRHLDHLPPPCPTSPSQPTGALRTRPDAVCNHPRWHFPTPSMIILCLPLLARLLLPGFWLFHMRFGKCRWRRLLLFQLLNALLGRCQLLLKQAYSLPGLLELLF
jgi:hypothetical protein